MTTHKRQNKIQTLLSSCLHDIKQETLVYIPRFGHRLDIIEKWSIEPGTRILDIGCGQGESSLALALEVNSSHITGIDTARLDYGVPLTVGESQEYALKSSLGQRISFVQTDASSLLKSLGRPLDCIFDAAVLCHSLWYFPDRQTVFAIFETLRDAGIPKVYVAEYAYEASIPEQIPHVLSAKAQALFHAYKVPREAGTRTLNVRAGPSKTTILDAARIVGFTVIRSGTFIPADDLLEGDFEARYIKDSSFADRVKVEKFPKGEEDMILAYGPRVEKAMDDLSAQGINQVRTMDVWWAEFELKTGF